MSRSVGVLAFAVATAIAIDARADQAACVRSAEQGQVARRDGKLREAHRHFLACTTDCPRIIASDCGSWAEQVLAATPTIVVDARDEAGHDVGDATLTIDGELVARQLDGKAIPVDPGSHTLTLQRGTSKVNETIIAKEGAKARPVQMRLSPAPSAAPIVATSVAPPPSADSGGGHTMYPWILVGAGAAVVVVGVVLLVSAPSLPPNCETENSSCRSTGNTFDQTAQLQLQKDREAAGQHVGQTFAGWLTMGVGGAVVLGGLIWHFLEPTKPRNAIIAPWLLPGSGGMTARLRF